MSNQFYDYLSLHINDYFIKNPPNSGDKFFIRFDHQEEVTQFLSSIKNKISADFLSPFEYTHEGQSSFHSYSIQYGDTKLILAAQSSSVTADYLVLLRNLVSQQQEHWQNTALLMILPQQLDSIEGGSRNLQKQGMPLHVKSLIQSLKNDVEHKLFNESDQALMSYYLSQFIEDHGDSGNVNFMDFEPILDVLAKGKVATSDYEKLGFFKDDLTQYVGTRNIELRLKENQELYQIIQDYHLYNVEKVLDRKFTPEGQKKLKADGWKDLSYSQVNSYIEQTKKKFELINSSAKQNNKKLNLWEVPKSSSAAGRKHRHIIIFNPEALEQITLTLEFNIDGDHKMPKSIKSSGASYKNISGKANVSFEHSGKKLKVLLNDLEHQPFHVHTEYTHVRGLKNNFYITILPFDEELISNYKASYSNGWTNDHPYLSLEDSEGQIRIGNPNFSHPEEHTITSSKETIKVHKETNAAFSFDPDLMDGNQVLKVNLQVEEFNPIELLISDLPNKPHPITGTRLWQMKREKSSSVIVSGKRLIIGNEQFYDHAEYRQFIHYETRWIEESMFTGIIQNGELFSSEDYEVQNLPLREAYNRFINYFKGNNRIPFYEKIDENYLSVAIPYLNAYIHFVENLSADTKLMEDGLGTDRLGTIYSVDQNQVFLTPFHPLNVAYQIELYNQLQSTHVNYSIINRLRPDALLPILSYQPDGRNQQWYKPESQNVAPEWITYKPIDELAIVDAEKFLDKVIFDKMNQFINHFDFLFNTETKASLKLNVIEISSGQPILKGIGSWMFKQIEKYGVDRLIPVEVRLYNQHYEPGHKDLDDFSQYDFFNDLEHQFDDLRSLMKRSSNYLFEDLIQIVRSHLKFYRFNQSSKFEYAHISFYKMRGKESIYPDRADNMKTGMALCGLYSTLSATINKSSYLSGFGTKLYPIEEQETLAKVAYAVNEFNFNMRDAGNNPYSKGTVAVSSMKVLPDDTFTEIYEQSHWVTFIEPTVDLGYFHGNKNVDQDLLVIHYSDQYTSSFRYDAITVTNKAGQYQSIVKEFFKANPMIHHEPTDQHIVQAIKAFNTINGEWLLEMIRRGIESPDKRKHFSREKFSILSAVRYALALFDHPAITWVPISLEEVLRVAGAAGFTRDSVFSAKSLNRSGTHSDDLLLIGLEESVSGLKLHFFPVEVKIGINDDSVIKKAIEQIQHTKDLFRTNLYNRADDTFENDYYRLFFAQLFLTNAKKIHESDLWPERNNYDFEKHRQPVITALLKGDFTIDDSLESHLGDGIILSFKQDVPNASLVKGEDYTLVHLPEAFGIRGILQPIQQIKEQIDKITSDIKKEDLIESLYTP
ncbi:DNA phosphorothioation-dependent restriction protein DptH [Exiguobacterium sp.]|uniref:DNA phosphorothioation-dependent restriction protein DptH n=1 Tax=Exiguobacterium sp. TaxID=44751 RepID=UPI0028A8F29E|nr:DNA phosphorothioation-dependent restriction protein DptH [Exiguobacterium sp.]